MNPEKIKVIAMDLDGTLTQHKQPMTPECRETLIALSKKYETTFAEVDHQISETESSLANLLGELTGNEFDMQGINELKKLLGGEQYEAK